MDVNSYVRSMEPAASDVFGVLARSIPSRLIEVSRSGCLLESGHRVEHGTIGELCLEVEGALLVDDVRVTRCVQVEGAGSSYLLGAEFVQTRRPGPGSIRRAVTAILRGLTPAQNVVPAESLVRHGRRAAAANASSDVDATPRAGEGEGIMRNLLARFVREDQGQDIIEYALLAGIITTGVVALITAIATKVNTLFTNLNTQVQSAP